MRDAAPELTAFCTLICCRAPASAASRCARSRSIPAPCSSTLITARRTCATLPSASPGDALTPVSLRGSFRPAGATAAAAAAGTGPTAAESSPVASDSPGPRLPLHGGSRGGGTRDELDTQDDAAAGLDEAGAHGHPADALAVRHQHL